MFQRAQVDQPPGSPSVRRGPHITASEQQHGGGLARRRDSEAQRQRRRGAASSLRRSLTPASVALTHGARKAGRPDRHVVAAASESIRGNSRSATASPTVQPLSVGEQLRGWHCAHQRCMVTRGNQRATTSERADASCGCDGKLGQRKKKKKEKTRVSSGSLRSFFSGSTQPCELNIH